MASGVDVAKIMKEWILKVGFPVVSVVEEGEGKIRVRQDRFLKTGDVKPEENETLWLVALLFDVDRLKLMIWVVGMSRLN